MKALMVLKKLSDIPSEFQLFPYGRIEIESEGHVLIDDECMDQIISNFKSRGNDIVIDYEHQTLKDVQAPAAGWIKGLFNRGSKGLWAVVEWTKKASDYLKNREYRYFSPVFHFRKSDRRVIAVHSAALTNLPKINHLRPIIAKLNFQDAFETDSIHQIAKALKVEPEDIKLIVDDFMHGSDESSIDDRQRHINNLMGISDECFLNFGPSGDVSYSENADQERATASVAKLMGITKEDIERYAFKDRPSDAEHVNDNEPLKHIAQLMGISVEDIERYGL